MADDPWAEFRAPQATAAPADEWAPFRPAETPRGVMDKLLGINGPRYQIWPEKAVRGVLSGVMLPGQVMQEANSAPPQMSDSDVSVLSVPNSLNLATLALPVNPAVRAGDRAIPGVSKAMRPEIPAVPTTRQLADAGGRDIQAAENSGLDISAPAIADYSRKIQSELKIHPVDAPNTFAKLKEVENAPPGAIFTAPDFIALRRSLGDTAQNFNPNAAKDQLAASRAIKQLDQFLPTLNEKDVLAGSPAATAKLLERGNANYAAGMRSNDLTGNLDRANTGLLERAENRAQASNSGRNIDNTIRGKVASLLEKPKEVSGFSDPELEALNQVIGGGPVRNSARYVGNLLGGGGGTGQAVMTAIGGGTGAAVGGIPGAIVGAAVPSVIGSSAKGLANVLAKRSVRSADEMVRKNSPMFKDAMANPEMATISPEKRAAFARALLMLESQQQ